ncbi:family 16 glycoside hydrolase [Aporhodopirellula aestuarii]|uniref:DUF1080 domain-containing protein n=1 Tax=Aporhodopirellula aestuarii TaxID=2950107 RepID=A0ABT0UC87_9BACT|nr:family 16 glycoside hydrolase [Aporhodopirellula aestuarii]MCM2374390.1 DUF1080 domain-containing protein [Aporhodopirellula aestuarii]
MTKCHFLPLAPSRIRLTRSMLIALIVAATMLHSLTGTVAVAQDEETVAPKQTRKQTQQVDAPKDTDTKPSSEEQADASPADQKATEDKTATDDKTPAKDEKPASQKPSAKKDESKAKQPAAEPVPDPEWVAKGAWLLPPTKGPAAIDFSLVGEYVGDVKPGEEGDKNSSKRLGVQIRNLGTGEFEARAYQGGLPGQDSYEDVEPMVLVGRRSGSTLVLSGGPWAMFAGPKECKIIDASGTTLAKLPRVERKSPTLGAAPPEGAIVLFDGTDTKAFVNGKMTNEKLLEQGADINFMLNDFDLHLEFRIPHMPAKREQARGNSGIYLQSRYECQVLDSFADAKVFNGLGALYRHKTPKLNMAFPPLTWQTYDIHFTAARFAADGSKLRNARVTSWVNGVMVQDDEELPGPTGHGQPESPTLLPTKIQDHNDPVRFRNVWVIDRGLVGGVEFPPMSKSE